MLISYAHLAATKMGQFMKFKDNFETFLYQGGATSTRATLIPQSLKL